MVQPRVCYGDAESTVVQAGVCYGDAESIVIQAGACVLEFLKSVLSLAWTLGIAGI